MENIKYYTVLPAYVRLSKEIGPSEKILYAEIGSLTRKKGYCFATNEFFAKLYGVSKISISNWISKLENAGFIKTEPIYREGSKWLQGRKIYMMDDFYLKKESENIKAPSHKENFKSPHKEKFKGPLKENFNHNNTSNNNTSIKYVIDTYNSLGINKLKGNAKELRLIEKMLKDYGLEDIKRAFKSIKDSAFLMGEKTGFRLSLEFLSKKENFQKILKGYYEDFKKPDKNTDKKTNKISDQDKLRSLVRSLREEFERIKNDHKS